MEYDQDMRQAVYDRMHNEWNLKSYLLDDLPQHLAELCGRAEKFVFRNTLSDTERDICKKLLGEHGYAYYKALLARLEA